jgi:hypothetical protein
MVVVVEDKKESGTFIGVHMVIPITPVTVNMNKTQVSVLTTIKKVII